MKKRHLQTCCLILLLLISLSLCACEHMMDLEKPTERIGQIYLYGESHADDRCLEKELARWAEHYENGMRDLFIEMPFYTAAYLNEWMHSDSDEILDMIYQNTAGTQMHSQNVFDFYRQIKQDYPETVFHGTDVGHQYNTIGAHYLQELQESGQEDSDAYALAQEIVEQGRTFYDKRWQGEAAASVYRENCMVENFVREYQQIYGADVMGIYGTMHTDPDGKDSSGRVDSMAKQLAAICGDALHTENLTYADPEHIDQICIGETEYEATYFGSQDLSKTGLPYLQREFWRLENAYDDFASYPLTDDVLPYNNYPLQLEKGQVFVIDYTGTDGTVMRKYYRSDGNTWNNLPVTQEFVP